MGYSFLKNYVAPAAQELTAAKPDEEVYGRDDPRRDEAGDDQLAAVELHAMIPTSPAQVFGYKLNEDVYRCMLWMRQFNSDSSLEMHRSNLESSSLVAKGCSRLANIFRSTANVAEEKAIEAGSSPKSASPIFPQVLREFS